MDDRIFTKYTSSSIWYNECLEICRYYIDGVSMWLVYGLLVESTPIIMANTATLGLNLVILRFKLRYG
jgi:uncharacterized protein with PQ loop repeat